MIETTLTHWRPGLGMTAWDDHKNYIGETVEGWFVYSKHRDSDLLEQSNFDAIVAALIEVCKEQGADPVECIDQPVVNHWAVGWMEQIVVLAAAPEPVIRCAEELLGALADYPALDDSDLSEREWNAAADYWDSLSPRDKVQEAIDTRSRAWWLAKVPAWPIGRISWSELANPEDRWPIGDPRCQLANDVYDRVRESCR